MKLYKTSNYDLFKLRPDNRERIDQSHVNRIKESIQKKNLLDMMPLIVNPEMEILDGQHRFLAAKMLKVDIFYKIEEGLDSRDIILLNNSKSWVVKDYLNYYVKNNHSEYLRLKKFIDQEKISLQVAISIAGYSRDVGYRKFREGDFVFNLEEKVGYLDICRKTQTFIKKIHGAVTSAYLTVAKFIIPLMQVIQHEVFNEQKWFKNLELLIDKVGPRARSTDYRNLFIEIHDYRNPLKIRDFKEED